MLCISTLGVVVGIMVAVVVDVAPFITGVGNSSCVLVLEPYSSQTSPEIYSTLPCRLMNKSTHYSTLAMSYSQLLYSLFVNSYLLYSHVLCHVQT